MKHIEEIVEYIVDGSDLQYFDNHGSIVRCRDCKNWKYRMKYCQYSTVEVDANHYCGFGIRKEEV